MAQTRELTICERKKIVKYHEDGWGYKRIAKKTGFAPSSIQTVIRKWKKDGNLVTNLRPGRPRCTTGRMDRRIVTQVIVNPRISAPKIAQDIEERYGQQIGAHTVRRRIKAYGLISGVAKKKPFISPKNRKHRLKWAREHASWTVEDWRSVIWSDETKFNMFGSDGVIRVWRERGKAMDPKYLRGTVKHGGGSVMFWGCIGWNGVGILYHIPGIMVKEVYRDILAKNLPLASRKLRMRGRYIFQHDNDPKHTAMIVKQWLAENRVNLLEWPAQSPDLNPIEHIWSELERRCSGRNPKNKTELVELAMKQWDLIEPSVVQNLVQSMPNRIAAVIRAKGGPTKY